MRHRNAGQVGLFGAVAEVPLYWKCDHPGCPEFVPVHDTGPSYCEAHQPLTNADQSAPNAALQRLTNPHTDAS